MEPNRMPPPPKEMRRMPPPPPPTAPKPQVAVPVEEVKKELPKLESVAPATSQPSSELKNEEVFEKIETKKIKKEGKKEDDLENIGIVDVRQTKKVDNKAMFYYVGIFVSLAVIAVLIFLILK